MSLVAFLLLVSVSPSHASVPTCEEPLKQIELKMKVAAENLAVANQPALPGMWPVARKTVACVDTKCKVEAHTGVRLSYEPYSFYADSLGLVGYPDIDAEKESIQLASLEWEYDLEKNSCDQRKQ